MSDKKETPVSWLAEQIERFHEWKLKPIYDENCFDEIELSKAIRTSLEMESKKQQKYDEMIEMLEVIVLAFEHIGMEKPMSLTEVIKEAKEL
jgi:hypothetical protein